MHFCAAGMRTSQALLVITASTMLSSYVIGLPVEARSECNGRAELVFLLDASNNVWLPDFRHQLDFVREVVDWFTISRDAFRVSIVTYADYPQIQVLLSEHINKTDLLAAIDDVDQTGGYHTHGGDALRYMQEFVFLDTPDPFSTRIAVIITNGLMDDHEIAVDQSAISRKAGVHIFAIGVGESVNVDELDEISSRPVGNFTITVESYSVLSRLSRTFAARICTVASRSETYQPELPSPIHSPILLEKQAEPRSGMVEVPDYHSSPVIAPGISDGSASTPTVSVSYGRDEERLVDDYLTDTAVEDGFEETPVGEPLQNRYAIEISDGPPGSGPGNTDGWYWRYDEHGSKVWYRIQGTGLDVDVNRKKVTNEDTASNMDSSILFPPTYHPSTNSRTPHRGYWLVDEQGNHVWYRYDGPGRYVRDSTVAITPSHNVTEQEGRLTWSGIEDMYWTVDTYGHRVWYKLFRSDDGLSEWFSRIDGDPDVGNNNDQNGSASTGGAQEDDAPHVYLSSGPGGRGGYWDIDEHGHYVWYHFVAPNLFERDESTATDVMSVPPGYQRPASQQLRTASRRTPTGELRRRPGKELTPGWGRPMKPMWLTRATPGQLMTGTAPTAPATKMSTTTSPSTRGRQPAVVPAVVESLNRGYWVLDTNGKMTWRSYLELPKKSVDSEQETIVENDDLFNWIPPSLKNPRTPKVTQLPTVATTATHTTKPTSTVTTTERPTTTAFRSTQSTTQEQRVKPNGYWARGKSGKMEWHTFGPIRQSTMTMETTTKAQSSPSTTLTTLTTTPVTTPTTITTTTSPVTPPTTSSSTTTTTTTTRPLTTTPTKTTTEDPATTQLLTSIGATSSSASSQTVVTEKQTSPTSDSYRRLSGYWILDEYGQRSWRDTLDVVDSTAAISTSAATDGVPETTSRSIENYSIKTTSRPKSLDDLRLTAELSSTITTAVISEDINTSLTSETVESTTERVTSASNVVTEIWSGVPDVDNQDDIVSEKLIPHEIVTTDPTSRGVVDALGKTLRNFLFGYEAPLTNASNQGHSINVEEEDIEVINDIMTSINNTAIREAVRHQLIVDADETEPPTAATTRQQLFPTPTENDAKIYLQQPKTTTDKTLPSTNRPATWHVTRNVAPARGGHPVTEKPPPVSTPGIVSRRTKTGGQSRNNGAPISRRRPQTNYAAKAWEQFIKDERDGDDHAVVDSEMTDVIKRQHPGTGVRQVVGVRRRPSGAPSRLLVRNQGSKLAPSQRPTEKPSTASIINPELKQKNITENSDAARKQIASKACRPRNPLDIIFAIDQRSTSPVHASHLWQIAFAVMSSIRIDDTRIRVRFIPEMIDGRHHQPVSGGINGNPANRQPAGVAGHRPVSEIINELADNMRQENKMAPNGSRRKEEKYRRRVGIYVTDGRSADTAGTVLAAEQATANFGRRRVDLVAVGVGPEVSETQLISVARGRRDRLLTAYRRAHGGQQVVAGVRDVSLRLLQILCDEDHR